VKEKKDVN